LSPSPETFWRDEAPDPGARLSSPSAERNAGPILDVLGARLPAEGRLLEIASGTGQHALWLAERFPRLIVQPSDPSPAARPSIIAWAAGVANSAPPLDLDVTDAAWPSVAGAGWDALLAVNLVHISPWAACRGLMWGAARVLVPGGRLFLYGCFSREGRHTSESNAQFDESLRAQDPAWGVRAVEDVAAEAADHGLAHGETLEMPANNLMLVFQRVVCDVD